MFFFRMARAELWRYGNGLCATGAAILYGVRSDACGTLARLQECSHYLPSMAHGAVISCPHGGVGPQAIAAAQGKVALFESLFWALVVVTVVSFIIYMMWYEKSLGHKACRVIQKLWEPQAKKLEVRRQFNQLMKDTERLCPERLPDLAAIEQDFHAPGREENA